MFKWARWTKKELEILCRKGVTMQEKATLLKRTVDAIKKEKDKNC